MTQYSEAKEMKQYRKYIGLFQIGVHVGFSSFKIRSL
jgi:hypothetical protein